MSDIKKVNIIGLGYVGLPTAALLARAGYEVRGVDIDDRIIGALNAGECPLGEAEVVEIVTESLQSGNLSVGKTPESADAFIICVPTPVTSEHKADVSMVKAAVASIKPFVQKGNLVILESTSPIGTTRDILWEGLSRVGLSRAEDIDICYCPERVFPGATVREILHNDRVVGGITPKAAERAKAFYNSFCEGSPITTTAESAEFSKLMENTYRDVNIALANVFSHIAETSGVDVQEVITLANRHPRVNVHTPGPGVGGHCIPVDPWFLIENREDQTQLLSTSRNINDNQAVHLLNRAEDAGLERGSKVAILGAAYRGNLDDARESPTEHLIKVLNDRGYTWKTHDPYVVHFKMHNGCEANLTSNLEESLDDASAVIVMTDHASYRALTPEKLVGLSSKIVVDGRRMLHETAFLETGFKVISVGAPTR